MTRTTKALTCLSLALAAAPLFSQLPTFAPEAVARVRSQESQRNAQAMNHIIGKRSELGLSEHHSFKAAGSNTDEFGMTHSYFQQHYQGVRVWGGDIVTHMDAAGQHHPHTDGLIRSIYLSPNPALTAMEALAIVDGHLSPKGAYAHAPTAELVIFPEKQMVGKTGHARHENAEDFEHQVVRTALAYHIHTSLRNAHETKDTDYMIDAHTGAILATWNDLHTSAATGTGNSQYSGTVNLNTNLNGSNYELNDVVGNMPIKTYNLNHDTSGQGTLYTDADNTWGDGSNYTGSTTSTTSATGQTAAVDAHYGIMATSAFYKKIFNRNGIDGTGRATYSSVHYSTSYDNAFWDDDCFCMTYGDGNQFKSLEALDVAAHEMNHGVCANNGRGGLIYSNESGGLNEANSDIMGNFVVFYTYGAGGTGTTIPDSISNAHGYTPWTCGSQLRSTPLRYMYKPSLDGRSADYWSSSVGGLDVHCSSGPGNHMMYFLSKGCTTSGNTSSTYAPNGFSGIGNDKAARIWYRALTTYFTSSMNYAACRTACLSACSDLYGTTGAEYAAVQNAFGAINVGTLAPTIVTINPTSTTINTGATQQFTATVTGSSNTSVTWTATGGTVNGSGLYTAPATAGTYTVKATSNGDPTKFAQATVKVGMPDLVITNVSVSPVTVYTGSVVTLSATVKNNGTLATPSNVAIGVGFGVDGNYMGAFIPMANSAFMSLGVGVSTSGSCNVTWTATKGTHTIQTMADDVNRIAESNESNNAKSLTINVVDFSLPVQATGCGTVPAGRGLCAGTSIWSCDGRFELRMQTDGNLVLYKGNSALWSSGTWGKAVAGAYMQTDGNLVVYSPTGSPLWFSNSFGVGCRLAVQDDGNLVVYNSANTPLWASNTSGN